MDISPDDHELVSQLLHTRAWYLLPIPFYLRVQRIILSNERVRVDFSTNQLAVSWSREKVKGSVGGSDTLPEER